MAQKIASKKNSLTSACSIAKITKEVLGGALTLFLPNSRIDAPYGYNPERLTVVSCMIVNQGFQWNTELVDMSGRIIDEAILKELSALDRNHLAINQLETRGLTEEEKEHAEKLKPLLAMPDDIGLRESDWHQALIWYWLSHNEGKNDTSKKRMAYMRENTWFSSHQIPKAEKAFYQFLR